MNFVSEITKNDDFHLSRYLKARSLIKYLSVETLRYERFVVDDLVFIESARLLFKWTYIWICPKVEGLLVCDSYHKWSLFFNILKKCF